jgi:hypothetical protein
LPAVRSQIPLFRRPDLVASIRLSPDKKIFEENEPVEVEVVVTNEGLSPAGGFWVDFYINPSNVPQQTNTGWPDTCVANDPCFGITWGITTTLQPGEQIILTSTEDSYYQDLTNWPGSLPVAETVDMYAYVDSWNPDDVHGFVQESDETNNLASLPGLQVRANDSPANPAPVQQN